MSTGSTIQVGSPDQLDRMVAGLVTAGFSHRAELLRAVRRGSICLIEPRRDAVASMRLLKNASRPVLVLLGDDDYETTGPDGWATLPNLLRWARGAMVHGTGATIESYQTAIGMTLVHRRFVLVETSSDRVHEWGERFISRRIPVVGLLPTDGAHPLPREVGQ